MNTQEFDERFGRLIAAGIGGFWAVNPALVNLEDLLHSSTPGSIVRCDDVNAIRFLPGGSDELAGCIAGWVSEDA